MVKDGQVRELFRLLTTGKRLAFAARKTGMDEKTARKYREAKQLPSQRSGPAAVADPARSVRRGLAPGRATAPRRARVASRHVVSLAARAKPQGQFPDSQRRTFERKVRTWRATQGPNQKVMFAQVHYPGDLAASDFTHMDSLGVTLGGQPFAHLVYHFMLTYSNWESITL